MPGRSSSEVGQRQSDLAVAASSARACRTCQSDRASTEAQAIVATIRRGVDRRAETGIGQFLGGDGGLARRGSRRRRHVWRARRAAYDGRSRGPADGKIDRRSSSTAWTASTEGRPRQVTSAMSSCCRDRRLSAVVTPWSPGWTRAQRSRSGVDAALRRGAARPAVVHADAGQVEPSTADRDGGVVAFGRTIERIARRRSRLPMRSGPASRTSRSCVS